MRQAVHFNIVAFSVLISFPFPCRKRLIVRYVNASTARICRTGNAIGT